MPTTPATKRRKSPSAENRQRPAKSSKGRLLISDLLAVVEQYLDPEEVKAVYDAYLFGAEAHEGQTRRSGEAYIFHPLSVAAILGDIRLDSRSIIAALLHDVIEDTPTAKEELATRFGKDVAQLVDGVSKIDQIDFESREHAEAENFRKMLLAMAKDIRVILIKLADRLHNMRTLQYMPLEKRASIARETLEIFSPLAHRLGMWQFKTELQDMAFMHLFPSEYEQLDRKINSQFVQYQETLMEAQSALEDQLQADSWLKGRLRSVHVVGRTKSIYSTFKKMQRHECGIERIHDLVALRVVLNPEDQSLDSSSGAPGGADENALCYHVLGKVHASYTPLPRTLKDYISSPKPNGYRSLHTTVLVGTQPLEVQIRTQAMHSVAEYGAAAHWAREMQGKDGSASTLPWLQIIREWQVQVDSAHEFMQLVRQELLGTRVFVFTANGRILNLARGATLADAASHQDLRLSTHSPKINGKAAPWSRELQNGDIVSFERSSMRLVDRLASEIAPLDIGEDVDAGSLADAVSDTRVNGVSGGGASGEREGSRVQGLDPEIMSMGLKQRAQRYLKRTSRRTDGWTLCKDCMPLVGDKLVGASTEPPSEACGGVIHASCECPTLQKQLQNQGYRAVADEQQAALYAALDEQRARDRGLSASLVIYCTDRRGMLVDVASVVTEGVTNILNVHSEIFEQGGKAAFRYDIIVQDRAQIEAVMAAVRKVPDVSSVERAKEFDKS